MQNCGPHEQQKHYKSDDLHGEKAISQRRQPDRIIVRDIVPPQYPLHQPLRQHLIALNYRLPFIIFEPEYLRTLSRVITSHEGAAPLLISGDGDESGLQLRFQPRVLICCINYCLVYVVL